MPQKTFRNLMPQRQHEIIHACLEEFAMHDYRDASLTRIIDKLGLAKGSFYRYFASKRDVYAYLIVYAMRHSMDLFEQMFADSTKDILDVWTRFVLACVEQDNAYPLLGYFAYRLAQERRNVVLGDVPRRTLQRGMDVLLDLFVTQQRQGTIRADVDAPKMVYLLMQVQAGFLDYLSSVHAIDFETNIRRGRPLFTLPVHVLREELRTFAGLMRHGFAGPAAQH